MTKFQPKTDPSSMRPAGGTDQDRSLREEIAGVPAPPTVQSADPLPWLIRQLRGRNKCGQVSADETATNATSK